MALETTAASGALIKFFGLPVLTGAIATSLGFMFMWPRTKKEAFVRFSTTILFSTVCGPALAVMIRNSCPELFDAAKEVAVLYGLDPTFGILFIAAPLMVMGGLPAWYILGGLVRWFERRRNKDIGEMATDAARLVHRVRGRR